eukprot:759885_1
MLTGAIAGVFIFETEPMMIITFAFMLPILTLYSGLRIVRPWTSTMANGRARDVIWIIFMLLISLFVALLISLPTIRTKEPNGAIDAVSVYIVCSGILIGCIWIVDIFVYPTVLVLRLSSKLTDALHPTIDRVASIASLCVFTILVTLAVVNGYTKDPRIWRMDVPLTNLSACMDGYRIGMMSDVHASALVHLSDVVELTKIMNGEDVDMIGLVGDFSDGHVSDLGDRLTPFQSLQSKDSSFYVTGNHEYYYPVDGSARVAALLWIEYFESIGVRDLNNARVRVPTNNSESAQQRGCSEQIELAGVEDFHQERYTDLDGALVGMNASLPLVLLAHQPLQFQSAAGKGVDLQISGHTHGGQFWP